MPRFRPPLGPPSATPQQKVMALWRRTDLAPLEKSRASAARPLGQVMTGVLQQLGLERRRAESEVVRAWAQFMDPNVVAHARPAGLVRGTLFISVDSSVWLDELVRYRRRDILTRLQSCFGRELIQRLSFRVGL